MSAATPYAAAVDAVIALLESVGEQDWAGRLRDAKGDADRLRRCFGGMGSLSDVQISPHNGHTLPAGADEDALNDQLDALRTELWTLLQR